MRSLWLQMGIVSRRVVDVLVLYFFVVPEDIFFIECIFCIVSGGYIYFTCVFHQYFVNPLYPLDVPVVFCPIKCSKFIS